MYARKTYTAWVFIPLWVLQMILTVDALACLGFLILELQGEEQNAHTPPYASPVPTRCLLQALQLTPQLTAPGSHT